MDELTGCVKQLNSIESDVVRVTPGRQQAQEVDNCSSRLAVKKNTQKMITAVYLFIIYYRYCTKGTTKNYYWEKPKKVNGTNDKRPKIELSKNYVKNTKMRKNK